MSVLTRKLGRDLLRLKGQVATIGLVLACGVMSMLMLRATWGSLLSSRDEYYAAQRFGDVFARLRRAPEAVARRLEEIPGVARVYTRVVEEVMVPLAAAPEPVPGRIVSIPDDGPPPLNGLVVRGGRLPAPGATGEVVILEAFASAWGLGPGDKLPVVLNGELRQLTITGTAMSPEYIFAVAGGDFLADEKRFVVIWMPRAAAAPIFRMDGAFDDVSLALQRGASPEAVLAAVDRELGPYGVLHAVTRDRQLSNYILSGELAQLRTLALIIPIIFLAVATFLVNVVLSRLVYLERPHIAVLKALGRPDREIGLHYLGLVTVIVGLGGAVGIAAGVWSGRWMTDLYSGFFRFPSRLFHLPASLLLVTLGISLAAAVAGALGAVYSVVRLPPAQAMRPAAPPTYRRSLGSLGRLFGPSAMMIVREIARRPWRFLLSTVGIAFGVGMFILGRFSWDSFDWLMTDLFPRQHREDIVVSFREPRPERAVGELAHLPGVLVAEGSRTVAVRFHAGSRWRDSAIVGLPVPSELRQLIHARRRVVEPPDQGVLMTDRLAGALGVGVGDRLDAEIMEGAFATRSLIVAGLIDEPFGLQAYARRDWLAGWLREEPTVTAAALRVDAAQAPQLRARLKELPAVISSTSVEGIIARYRKQTGQSVGVITAIITLSAAAIAVGVVYNNARIALSLRSRDLASLRVLGFRRKEISAVLLGELGAQVFAGIPLGLLLGNGLARLLITASDPETVRFPLLISSSTYATAAAIALVSGLLSALLVRRKLDKLDLIAVLKATE